jgi:hypothetical protein
MNVIAETEGTPESARFSGYLTDRLSYRGRSGRIHGFNRIAAAIGSIPNIRIAEPVILLDKLYAEYAANGLSSTIRDCAVEIFGRLQGDQHELIVRRLFPDRDGNAQDGERSGNVQSAEDLIAEIGKFYDFFTKHYDTSEVTPEIMVHRVVDTGNPPLRVEPFLPHQGGDVTPIDPDTYQVQALWGADESVQGYPHDTWNVRYHPDGSAIISPPTREQKTHSKIPAPGEYREIEIPEEDQDRLPLSRVQILCLLRLPKIYASSMAHIAWNLMEQQLIINKA